MAEDMQHWTPRPRPDAPVLEGRFARLERLDVARHLDDLYTASATPEAPEKFRYLFDPVPTDRDTFRTWVEKSADSTDPLFYAVIDRATGRAVGRQTLMRIDQAHGVIEIGNIYWGPAMARTPVATEALYLFAAYAFDTLGYRRFEWKCNDDNQPSKRAALRFGFQAEGVFRQHMVAKGLNRDTAWFAMIDKDWARLKPAYQAWLDPSNFDAQGQQKRGLAQIIAAQTP